MSALDELGLATQMWPMPVEIPDAIRFDVDESTPPTTRRRPDGSGWRSSQMDRVFEVFRSRFVGKVSPVHLFWGALDLAVTRFSGRPAPPHPGGAPNCGPHVMHEAYSHEVSSAGYWPGPDGEGVFYSYAYPEPPGLPGRRPRRCPTPATTTQLGEFVLPYTAVRTADDPDARLLDSCRPRTRRRPTAPAGTGPRSNVRRDRRRRRLLDDEGGDHAEHPVGRLDVVEDVAVPHPGARRRSG